MVVVGMGMGLDLVISAVFSSFDGSIICAVIHTVLMLERRNSFLMHPLQLKDSFVPVRHITHVNIS